MSFARLASQHAVDGMVQRSACVILIKLKEYRSAPATCSIDRADDFSILRFAIPNGRLLLLHLVVENACLLRPPPLRCVITARDITNLASIQDICSSRPHMLDSAMPMPRPMPMFHSRLPRILSRAQAASNAIVGILPPIRIRTDFGISQRPARLAGGTRRAVSLVKRVQKTWKCGDHLPVPRFSVTEVQG